MGNVEYCLALMENALKQFGAFKEIAESEDEEFSEKDTNTFIVRLCDILRIFLTLVLNSDYNSVFFEKTTAAQLVLYVIEGVSYFKVKLPLFKNHLIVLYCLTDSLHDR